jgi:hypothetical protein
MTTGKRVDTYMTHMGQCVVRVQAGCTQTICFFFNTRHDAACFLQALRKQAR